MAEGSIFKRCSCRNEQGRRLHARCPKLRRPGGAWNPTHGWWAYQLELPPKPTGQRRQLRRSGFDTREHTAQDRDQAQGLLDLAAGDPAIAAQIADLLAGARSGRPLPDRDLVARRVRAGVSASRAMPLSDYLWQWQRSRKVQPTTIRGYDSHIRNYLQPHLGHLPIDQLRIGHVQAMFDAITDRNTAIEAARGSDDPNVRASVKGMRTMSAASMHRLRATLRKALNDAIRCHRLIEFNPAAHIELPPGKRPKAKVWTAAAVAAWKATGQRPSPVMVWTPHLAGQFLDYAETHDIALYPLYVLILHRGLRRGEAVGLRDADLDLNTGFAVISQQITTVGYTPVTKQLKTDAAARTIPLDAATLAALRAYHARRARWQLVSGPTWPHTGLFFVRPDGQP